MGKSRRRNGQGTSFDDLNDNKLSDASHNQDWDGSEIASVYHALDGKQYSIENINSDGEENNLVLKFNGNNEYENFKVSVDRAALRMLLLNEEQGLAGLGDILSNLQNAQEFKKQTLNNIHLKLGYASPNGQGNIYQLQGNQRSFEYDVSGIDGLTKNGLNRIMDTLNNADTMDDVAEMLNATTFY